MRQKFLVLVFLAILIMQPMVAFTGTLGVVIEEPSRDNSVAQDAGTRLGPGEHTNHVPFAINETADFVTQGWPGSGTELDPFVISGLNISMAVFGYCIRIHYTDAYFVIRDCFIKGESVSFAIDLMNATHGRIEYTTVISDSMAIYALFSDSLHISHVYAEGIGMPIMFTICHDSTMEWSVANCSAGIGVYVSSSDSFTSSNNYAFTGSSGGYGIFFSSCNYSSSSFDVVETDPSSGYSFYISSCHYSSVSDFTSITGAFGLMATSCPSSNFTRGSITNAGSIGVQITGSPNMRFSDTTIYDTTTIGGLVSSCNNSVISNIDIEGAGNTGLQFFDSDDSQIVNSSIMTVTGGYGLYCDTNHDLVLDGISVEDISSTGVYLYECDRPEVTNVDVTDTGVSGIYMDDSPNGTITNCYVEEADSSGIHIDDCENTLIGDNIAIDTYDAGIFAEYSDNVAIYRNYITEYGFNGIDVQYLEDASVENNTIDGPGDKGIRSFYSDRTYMSRNVITSCDDGIDLYYSDNGTVTLNTVTDADGYACRIYQSEWVIITNNTLSAHEDGINVNVVDYGTFDYNTMIECGFYFVVGYAMSRYNHSMVGNTVNGKPVYYAYNDDHAVIDASLYGQILLLNSSYAEIGHGTFDMSTTAVHLFYCTEVVIHNLEGYGNYHTFMIYNSDNTTLRDSNMVGRYLDRGLYSSYNDNLLIQNCTFSRFSGSDRNGITLQNAHYTTITNCSFNYNTRAIRWSSSDNVTVSDCSILNSEQYAIYAWGSSSQYGLISGNTILNASRGFYSHDTSDGLITNNIIKYCSDDGINLGGSNGNDWNVTLNTVESNYYGINAYTSDYHFIMENTVRWNDYYGIYAFGSTGTEVFYNTFALNGVANGYDSRSGNYWDDDNATGIPMGNWWHDYSPPGIYWVDGSGGNTDDRYPTQYLPTEPIINQPQDITFAEFSTGNELVWNPFDDSLLDWEVTVDGVLFADDAWNFVDITVVLDELEYGIHEVVVTVWDIHGNNVTDSVMVNVYDDIDPDITGPAPLVAFADATGQTLTWDVYDLHPGEYEVRVDDVIVETGTWTSGTVTYNIDGLDAGVHSVYLWIYDLDRNSNRDGVSVEVVDDNTAPTIDSPDDISYEEGTTGNSIAWTPTDDYPATYQVSFNNSVIESGNWGGSRIVAYVDGLPVGTHTLRLTVFDGSGLSVYDEVTAVVTAVEVVTPPPVEDYTLLLVVGAVAAAAIVVVVIVLLLKKKQAA